MLGWPHKAVPKAWLKAWPFETGISREALNTEVALLQIPMQFVCLLDPTKA